MSDNYRGIIFNRYSEIASDKKHLISREQIEAVKRFTRIGNVISFVKDEDKIAGEIKEMYPHIFVFTDGRSFTWVDYILGSPAVLKYVKEKYPVDKLIYDYVCIPAKTNYKHDKKKVES